MQALLISLLELVFAVLDVLWSLGQVLLPWSPLAAWVIFWMFAVNWVKTRDVLVHKGGWVGVLLLAVVWIIVWGVIAPPASGYYDLFGLHINNFVGKTVYVTGLLCLMLLAGAAQLAGVCTRCMCFPDETVELEASGHGHDDHGHGHGADDHGHGQLAHAGDHH